MGIKNKKWTVEYEKEYMKEYRKKNKDKLRIQHREWKQKRKGRNKELNQQERARLKHQVLTNYSNGDFPKCVSCGFKDVRALTIDHIFNNGAEERREIMGNRLCAGTTFYRWLRKNDYPHGYQTLCFNCNWIKEIECRK